MVYWHTPGQEVFVGAAIRVVLLGTALAALPSVAPARDLYVDVARGDDVAGDGSAAMPWKTIGHAAGKSAAASWRWRREARFRRRHWSSAPRAICWIKSAVPFGCTMTNRD